MIARRRLLSAAALLPASAALAQQRRSLADPMRLGVDTALFDSGLARARPLLEGLGRGEFDAALTNAPEAQARLMRAFRIKHPAGKIFVAWIAGPKGRRVVAAHRAYRPA